MFWGTRSACVGAAACRHIFPTQRKQTILYQTREDCTRTEWVSTTKNSLHSSPPLPSLTPSKPGQTLQGLNFWLTNPPPTVVFRGPHDRYEPRDPKDWRELPVVSVVPVRRPKLKEGGTTYSFDDERDLIRDKMRAALTICAYNDVRSVVIGDFGLGSDRNPPRLMAELWREVFLWDPTLRGRIENVAFVFEDRAQSTARLIYEEATKVKGKSSSSSSRAGSSSKSRGKASSSSSSSGAGGGPTDYDIFTHVFDPAEIARVLAQPDMRMGVQNLMS